MARSDLLLQLVQSGNSGDKALFRKAVEAIISEEKSKQHLVLANKLQESLNSSTENGHTQLMPSKKNENRIDNLIIETLPQFRFSDLVLQETTLNLCRDFIEEHNRADMLRSFNLEPRNRILMVGPPGNGKTSLAEAISTELMIPFLTVRYEGIIASYLGETSFRLKSVFEYARTTRCVLFFDEFDSLGKERGDIHETGEIKRVVSSLLLQIDRLPSYVIVIAATNHPELLDKAVWRRFQIVMTIPKPTNKQIQAYLNKFEESFQISFGYTSLQLSKLLKGLSFSEVKDFCQDILRKYILSIPDGKKTVKSITRQRLDQLSLTFKPKITR
jgi:SpoVK/Ycf46/Vps4 family AAA+-type ATPase